MGNKEEKERKKAETLVAKAENLMDNDKPRKAGQAFQKAGDKYFELGEWKIAEQCYFYASKNYHKLDEFLGASNLLRLAANCSLLLHDFPKARDYYDLAVKTVLKSDAKNRDDLAATSMSFAFICHFLQGQQDEALNYIKRFKTEIEPEIFSHHLLVKLVRNLSNAIINQKESYLKEILEAYPNYKFRAAEKEAIDAAIVVSMCSVYMKYDLALESTDFERDEMIELNTKIEFSRLMDIQNHPLVPHKFESLEIIDMGFMVSDNLSVKKKPELPIKLNLGDANITLPFGIRTNFPGEGYIGPLVVTIKIDGLFNFFLKSNVADIKILSPDAILGVDLIPQKTPVINQTFPVQVVLSNHSDGDAMEIEVEFEFPEDLRLMRGTMKKSVYSLNPNEQITWQIQVKSMEVGAIPIKTIVSFKDGDGNQKGPYEAELPLEINL